MEHKTSLVEIFQAIKSKQNASQNADAKKQGQKESSERPHEKSKTGIDKIIDYLS